jgi:hypothetical protein
MATVIGVEAYFTGTRWLNSSNQFKTISRLALSLPFLFQRGAAPPCVERLRPGRVSEVSAPSLR